MSVEQYLISIKPLFAYRLFAQIKRFELRKIRSCIPEKESVMIVYASYPVRAIIGEFIVEEVLVGDPVIIEARIKSFPDSGVGDEDLEFIRGAKRAMALKVSRPVLYSKFVRLRELERLIPGFKPPLSMRPLEEGDPLDVLVLRKLREYTFMAVD